MISVPVSLNAAVRLGIADAIWNSGANSPLSVSEILPRLLVPSRESPAYTCILRTVPALTYGHIGNCPCADWFRAREIRWLAIRNHVRITGLWANGNHVRITGYL
ncbi:hypothetical protein DY000_02056051 [Brassica cretica]|uniref:Uncharacterized protein n=1 Tax=Brassica cretica TaxID=69181 RepID=A0ABQ7A6F6_BRACR|nr:hypothetical protein DY000_02056051 [Brassica cretica]